MAGQDQLARLRPPSLESLDSLKASIVLGARTLLANGKTAKEWSHLSACRGSVVHSRKRGRQATEIRTDPLMQRMQR